MARYADEGAVAQSAQSYYHLPVPNGLPWTAEVVDLIDELAAERLPAHRTAAKREQLLIRQRGEFCLAARGAVGGQALSDAGGCPDDVRATPRSPGRMPRGR